MKISLNNKRFAGNTLMLYIMKFSSILFPLITLPYLTRILGTSGYSIYTFVLSFTAYFVLFIDFGFILSATKDIAQNSNDKTKVEEILSSVIGAKLFFSLISLGLAVILIFVIPNLRYNLWYSLLSIIGVILSTFIPDFFFRGLEKMTAVTVRYIITKLIFTGLMFVFIKTELDLIFIPILNLFGEIIGIALTWIYIIFTMKYKLIKVSVKKIFLQIKNSAVYFYSRIASTVYSNTNVFVLGLYFPATVGLYGVSNSIVSAIRGMYSPLADSLYPYMIQNHNFRMVKKILLIFMPIVLVGCIVLFIWAPFFVNIVGGAKFIDSANILRCMVPILLFSLPTYILGFPTMGPLGLNNKANSSIIYSSIFHVIGLLVLIALKSVSMISVALLTSFTELIVLSIRVFWLIKYKISILEDNHKVRILLKRIKGKIIMPSISFFFSIFPICKNKIFFSSYLGSKISCNPKAFYDYIVKNYNEDFKCIWEYNNNDYKSILDNKTICVKSNSFKFYYHYYTSKILINNVRSSYYLKKRKGQYYIQTWHGSLALKKIEKDAENYISQEYIKKAKIDSTKIDLLLSGSKECTKQLKNSFWYDKEIYECGLPRCDILFENSAEKIESIRKKLLIEDDLNILLYAPTFRNNTSVNKFILDDDAIIDALQTLKKGKWLILYRLHPNMFKVSNDLKLGRNALNVTLYPDIQELMLISDVFITDISSSMFEFILTKKPCFLYLNDLEQYLKEERNLYFNIEDLPFSYGNSQTELIESIKTFELKEYLLEIEKFLIKIGNVENGNSCKLLYEKIKTIKEE